MGLHTLTSLVCVGHMGQVPCAPTDPTFWMHHAFIDLIWEEFRTKHQITDIELEYPALDDSTNNTSEYPTSHQWWMGMEPFPGVVNAHGMSSHFTNYYYQYTPRPSSLKVHV